MTIAEIHSLGVQLSPESTCLPSPVRCVDILVTATLAPANESPVALIECTFTAIMRLSLLDDGFWTTITSNDKFSSLAQRLLVDERKVVRKFVAEAIADTIEIESQVASSDGIGSLGNYVSSPSRIRYFWSVFSDSLAKVITVPDRCQEFFGILQILLLKSNSIVDSAVPDLPKIAWETAELLLNHRCTEVSTLIIFALSGPVLADTKLRISIKSNLATLSLKVSRLFCICFCRLTTH